MKAASDVTALAERIAREIPLTRAMGLSGFAWDGATFRMSAPLSANHNDKGTAFAGSLSGGANLAGWCLVNLLLGDLQHSHDVVVVDARQRYLRGVTEDLVFTAVAADPDAVPEFIARLGERGKARLDVRVEVREQGEVAFLHEAAYVALKRKNWLQKA